MKVIITDLDGTLLNDNLDIDNYTMKCFDKLFKNGNKIIIATGRSYSEVMSILPDQMKTKIEFYICDDGSHIYNSRGVCIWQNRYLGMDDVARIFEISNVNKLLCCTVKDNYLIVNSKCEYYKSYVKKMITKSNYIIRYKEKLVKDIYKIIIFDNIEPKQELLEKFNIKYRQCNKNGIDILNKETHKWSAIKSLIKLLNLNMNDIYFFGDDYNDTECFLNISKSVIVSNGKKEMKNIAKYHTESNNNSGVAKFIYKEIIYGDNK